MQIVYPQGLRTLSGGPERSFMAKATPLSRSECAAAAFSLLFEFPGALRDLDFEGLRSALQASRRCGFKRIEIDRLPMVKRLLEALDQTGRVAATMSSFGPAVVVIARSQQDLHAAQPVIPRQWVRVLGTTATTGRRIFYA